jgi:ribosome-binding factor A
MAGKRRGGGSRRSGGGRAGRLGGEAPVRSYPRVARINEALRQVLADEIERLAIADERLVMLTITAVEADPDYRRAKVLFSVLGEEAALALADARVRLQASVARQVRLKWTPMLTFEADPAVAEGHRVEEILRTLAASAPSPAPSDPVVPDPAAPDSVVPDPASSDPVSPVDPEGRR